MGLFLITPLTIQTLLHSARRTLIMGIVNVTPDSFSDGGAYFEPDNAIRHALELADEGADILDFGAESTRPGAEAVPPEEQLRRLKPVIREVKKSVSVPISIDTTSARVAADLIDVGADIVNDISGMQFDQQMAEVVAQKDCPVIIMHIQGTPRTMQKAPSYKDVISDIYQYFQKRIHYAIEHDISEENIILDPGIGFGKTVEHNYRIIRELSEFSVLNKPLLMGGSRKSFIGATLDLGVDERLEGSLAVAAVSIMNGARILRVHDVQATVRVARMVDTILQVQETI